MQELFKSLNLKEFFLLHVGMDGPNVSFKFEKELEAVLKSVHDTQSLRLGTCSLHPVHSALKKRLEKLIFFSTFFNDLYFFFELSSVRREDYKDISEVTSITAEFVKKFGETHWICMELVGVHCSEQ